MRVSKKRAVALRLYAAVGVGAAIGSLLRFLSGLVIVSGLGVSALATTAFVNVIGSFAIMFLARVTGPDGRMLARPWQRQFVMSGLCGGFTTFSAMTLDTLALTLKGDPWLGALY